MKEPLVTMLIPYHDTSPYLVKTLISLKNLQYRNIEFVFVADRASHYSRIQVDNFLKDKIGVNLSSENPGIVAALNLGLRNSHGTFVARLDNDDCVFPDRLQHQVRYFNQNSKLVVVGSNIRLINDAGREIGLKKFPEKHKQIMSYLKFANPFAHSSTMFRNPLLIDEQLTYVDDFPYAEDYFFWKNLLKFGEGYNIQTPLTQYRVHETQISTQQSSIALLSSTKISIINCAQDNPENTVNVADCSDIESLRSLKNFNGLQKSIVFLSIFREKQLGISWEGLRIISSAFWSHPKPFFFFCKLKLQKFVNFLTYKKYPHG